MTQATEVVEMQVEVAGVVEQQVDPRTLLVDANVRLQTSTDKDLIASVKDLGILQPITVVRTVDGELRVRFGHRRTLAAIEAGLDTVPVRVIGDENTDKPGEIERLLTQFAENERREGLTEKDRISTVEQLSLLNISAAQIAKRTRMKRPDVDNALAVSKSDLAKAASERYDLTLDQAAAVAEFEDEPESVKALVAAVKTGLFDHTVARARQDRDDAIAKQTVTDELTAQGLRVVERPSWTDDTKPLDHHLLWTDENCRTSEAHSTCPGHVVWVDQEWVEVLPDGRLVEPDGEYSDEELAKVTEERRWVPEFGCENPGEYHPKAVGQHGQHTPLPDGEPETEEEIAARKAAASAERKRVIAGNKAWDAAVTVRREWLRGFLARKTAPAGTHRFLATAILNGNYPSMMHEVHPLAVELFGVEGAAKAAKASKATDSDTGSEGDAEPVAYPWRLGDYSADLQTLLDGATDKRLTMITLGLLLAGFEKSLHRMCWRGNTVPAQQRYLRFIAENGYTLCDVERLTARIPETDETTDQVNDEVADEASDQ